MHDKGNVLRRFMQRHRLLLPGQDQQQQRGGAGGRSAGRQPPPPALLPHLAGRQEHIAPAHAAGQSHGGSGASSAVITPHVLPGRQAKAGGGGGGAKGAGAAAGHGPGSGGASAMQQEGRELLQVRLGWGCWVLTLPREHVHVCVWHARREREPQPRRNMLLLARKTVHAALHELW